MRDVSLILQLIQWNEANETTRNLFIARSDIKPMPVQMTTCYRFMYLVRSFCSFSFTASAISNLMPCNLRVL